MPNKWKPNAIQYAKQMPNKCHTNGRQMPNKCQTIYQTNAKQYTKQIPTNIPNKCQTIYQTNAKQYTK